MSLTSFAAKLDQTAPFDCRFKVGDTVTFTNDYGVSFENKTVIGFVSQEEFDSKGSLENRRPIYIDTDCYWLGVQPCDLTFPGEKIPKAIKPLELNNGIVAQFERHSNFGDKIYRLPSGILLIWVDGQLHTMSTNFDEAIEPVCEELQPKK
jgi:hypothetical protein